MKKLVLFAILFPLTVVIFACYIVAIPFAFSLLDVSLLNPLSWGSDVRRIVGLAWAVIQILVVILLVVIK